MAGQKFSEKIREQVCERAKGLCEFCHAAEKWQYVRFTIEHMIPMAKGGTNELENLAFSCFHCNRQKSARMTAIDPEIQTEVALFNPRQDVWNHHFIWASDRITLIGLTATGRATIQALQMNRERALSIRAADAQVNRHPPAGDLIQPA